ncbi:MAG: hypothetical protein C5B59_12710 [Bacteroidetes bacterium]|nr:MAG: hypothetical protein C5B59_12710 [Bacteroidota bacterium]
MSVANQILDKAFVHAFLKESNLIEGVTDDDSLVQAWKAWDYLMKEDVLTKDVVLHTHKILMAHQKIRADQKGHFRKLNVTVGGYEAPDWKEVPNRMWAWTLEAMRRSPPIDDKQLHIEYEKIHPFVDGNGRTGRMFMNWMRIKRLNKPLLIILDSEKDSYYSWFR